MANLDNLRGKFDLMILFVLKSGDRNTDELKEIIDEVFYEVKIGTLYSVISKLKNDGKLKEYRLSQQDGSRRKFYSVTKSGLKYFEKNNNGTFDEYSIPEKFIRQEPIIEEKPVIKKEKPIVRDEYAYYEVEEDSSYVVDDNEKQNDYAKYLNSPNNTVDGDVDFSVFEEPTEQVKEEPVQETNETTASSNFYNEVEEEIVENDVSYLENVNYQNEQPVLYEDSSDNFKEENYKYESTLSELFPKNNPLEFSDLEEVNTENPNLRKDWNDIYEFSQKEGIKVRTSADTNRYQGSSILLSGLRLLSAGIITIVAILGYLLIVGLFDAVQFDFSKLLTLLVIFGSFTVVSLIIFIIKPNYKVKDMPKFINVLEISIVVTIATLVISFAVAGINNIDYTSGIEIFNSILYPTYVTFNVTLFVIIEYSLAKLDFFQTV